MTPTAELHHGLMKHLDVGIRQSALHSMTLGTVGASNSQKVYRHFSHYMYIYVRVCVRTHIHVHVCTYNKASCNHVM